MVRGVMLAPVRVCLGKLLAQMNGWMDECDGDEGGKEGSKTHIADRSWSRGPDTPSAPISRSCNRYD